MYAVVEVHRDKNGFESSESTGWRYETRDDAEYVAEGLNDGSSKPGVWFETVEVDE